MTIVVPQTFAALPSSAGDPLADTDSEGTNKRPKTRQRRKRDDTEPSEEPTRKRPRSSGGGRSIKGKSGKESGDEEEEEVIETEPKGSHTL